jgi:hypothetical protein
MSKKEKGMNKKKKKLKHKKRWKEMNKKKKKLTKKTIKKEELKIKVLPHESLASTLSYLMLAPCDTPILQISLY